MPKLDFDSSWLEAEIQDEIQMKGKAGTCTVQNQLWDVLSAEAQAYLRQIAQREQVTLVIVI